MYTKYFGFNEKPFTLTPNPRFIFLSKNHKEAFAHLLYGINNHYGFIELIGEVGTGKTTVLRTLLSQLQDANYRSALIFNPCLSGVELLRSINHEFGVPADSEYANELLADLNRFLLAENSGGKTVVLVIDEAQNLQPEVLEQIRLISNLETEDDKLIQIILAGQPELEALLQRPELRQLNQRIAVRYRLRSMSMDETRAYIRHRMEVAGETGGVSFGRYAIKWIYLYTRGVPRMINILCDRALLIAYGDERRNISAGVVTRAIREIINRPEKSRLSYAVKGLAVAVLAIALVIVGIRWLPARPQGNHETTEISVPAVSAVGQLPRLEQEIRSYDQNDTHIHAFNAIVSRWDASPLKVFSGRMTVPGMFGKLAARRDLRLTTYKGSLDNALRFNLPILVTTTISNGLGNYCFAVTSARDGALAISPPLFGSGTIRKDDLATVANGTYHLVWRNFGKIPDVMTLGERRYEVRTLQQLLKRAGFYRDAIDGDYSDVTARAVNEFQRSRGIPENKGVGELTLAALTSYDTTHTIPYLNRDSIGQKP
jgi:general secretion pathway protein A